MLRSDFQCSKPYKASGNALNAVFAKDAAEMTRDDAMTVACDAVSFVLLQAQGSSANCTAAGVNEVEWLDTFSKRYPMQPARAPTDEKHLRLGMLGLEICRDPQGLSAEEIERARAGSDGGRFRSASMENLSGMRGASEEPGSRDRGSSELTQDFESLLSRFGLNGVWADKIFEAAVEALRTAPWARRCNPLPTFIFCRQHPMYRRWPGHRLAKLLKIWRERERRT